MTRKLFTQPQLPVADPFMYRGPFADNVLETLLPVLPEWCSPNGIADIAHIR